VAGDQIVAVTGASRGIGAAIALALAARGFRVACLTRGGRLPDGIGPDLAGRLDACPCDVTDETQLARAFAMITARGGRLVGLVNNAGLHVHGPSDAFSTADWQRVMAVNATAVFVACREAHPHLVAAGGGTIVNLGSFFDRLGVKHNAAYCASKAAVGAITRCLAVEWAGDGIRVLDVAPGYIVTDLNRAALSAGPLSAYLQRRIPAGTPGTPEEVASLVATLFAERIPFLTGATIYVDGGQSIAH
jgi:NAD(P)-dependent dehydrogenase (short-subunit alcohol dehydrogenase family)